MSEKEGQGFLSSLWEAFASLRLTIALLIILAVASIFGTVILQNGTPEEYLGLYSISTYRILKILGFLDMYHAGWFVFLLGLLSANLVVCSLKRFRIAWRFFSHPQIKLEEGQWRAFPLNHQFWLKDLPADHLPKFRQTLSRTFGQTRILETSPGYQLFVEKEKLSRLGVYFIHLSVLIILAGALIGSFFGFRGYLNVVEGKTVDRVILRNNQTLTLPGFTVRLDKFDVSYYPSGTPKEFRSTVTLLSGDRQVLTDAIRVNHPLTFKGISFYQSNYGLADVQRVFLTIKERESGKEVTLAAQMETRQAIPDSASVFILSRFIPDFQGLGPGFQVVSIEPNRPHETFWIFQNHPELESKRAGRYQFAINEIEPRYYSGLQVTKDPGVWVVWVGCLLMMAGFYATFFMSHRRAWIRLTEKSRKTLVEIAGSSHRNQIGFQKELERIEKDLKEPPPGSAKKTGESEGQA